MNIKRIIASPLLSNDMNNEDAYNINFVESYKRRQLGFNVLELIHMQRQTD